MIGANGDPAFRTVYEALSAAAKRAPRKLAIHFDDESLDYEDLLSLIDNAALHLFDMGIRIGETFAAYSQNRPDLLICYYAAAKLGVVFVPLNPNLTASEVNHAFHHSGARFLLHDDVVADIALKAVPQGKAIPIAALRDPAHDGQTINSPDVDPQSDFLIIYTSGSTGTPKGIVLSHTAQVNAASALSEMWGVGENDVTVVGLPLGYLYGLSTAAAVGLQCGGTVVILRRFHPRDVLEALVASNATIYHGVPTMYSMMLEYCEQRELSFDLSRVRELICAGAPLPEEMRQRFAARFGRALHDYYAMTECTPVFGSYSGDPRPIPAKAIGRLAPGATVQILKPDGAHCEAGEEGEILVHGAATMKRYLNSPELTDTVMTDGFIRSGDLGYRDSAGYYYITGRLKDVIIRGGANISPSEVERVLATHPGVQDAAVVGAVDRIFGEVPVAFIVRRHGSRVSAEELAQHAEKVVSDFKVPRQYVFETDLPLGITGKVDKAELKRRVAVSAGLAMPLPKKGKIDTTSKSKKKSSEYNSGAEMNLIEPKVGGAPGVGPNALYFEDFSVGQHWLTPRRTITETDVVMFAAFTGDYNPVHTDEEFAKSTPFGRRILHGPAVFAIATGLEFRLGLKEGTAIAFLGMTWDLKAPVLIGDTIHVFQRVSAVRMTKNPGRGIVTFWVEVRNQRGEICQEGEWKVMFSTRASGSVQA